MQAEESAPTTWQGESEEPQATSYEVLQVHHAAPLELITAAYWRLAGQVQARRAVDKSAEADLHALTRAYQTLTNPALRADYDRSIGIAEDQLAPAVPKSRGKGLFGRKRDEIVTDTKIDYYEVLRIVPSAEAPIVEEAYSTLRPYYVRLVQSGYSQIELLDCLEEAYLVVSDPQRRAKYDSERKPVPVAVIPAATIAVSPAPTPKTPRPEKPKHSPAPSAPKAKPVRVSSATPPTAAASGGGSPLGAIGGAFGALGRQFSTMSRREQQQVEELKTEREHEHVDTSDVEAALLQRISSTVEVPGVNGSDLPEARSIARIIVVDGPDRGTIFEIQHFPLTIGSVAKCDITLPALAAEHARLLYRDGRFVVYNLAPRDLAAGEESEALWIVESGDDLALGPYSLRFTAIPN